MLTGNDGVIILVDKHSVYIVYKISVSSAPEVQDYHLALFFFFLLILPLVPCKDCAFDHFGLEMSACNLNLLSFQKL